jgi:hypothetical protein
MKIIDVTMNLDARRAWQRLPVNPRSRDDDESQFRQLLPCGGYDVVNASRRFWGLKAPQWPSHRRSPCHRSSHHVLG